MTKGKPWTYETLLSGAVPTGNVSNTGNWIYLNEIAISADGWIVGASYLNYPSITMRNNIIHLWDETSGLLVRAAPIRANSAPAATKWWNVYFRPRVVVVPGHTYGIGIITATRMGEFVNAVNGVSFSNGAHMSAAAGSSRSGSPLSSLHGSTGGGVNLHGVDLLFLPLGQL